MSGEFCFVEIRSVVEELAGTKISCKESNWYFKDLAFARTKNPNPE